MGLVTEQGQLEALFERIRAGDRGISGRAADRAHDAIEACLDFGIPVARPSIDRRAIVLTWTIRRGRTLVWYAEDEWRPARVVQQGDPAASHWADVGETADLAAILREELGEA